MTNLGKTIAKIIIISIIPMMILTIHETEHVFGIIYDNELLSGIPTIYFELPDEWRVGSIPTDYPILSNNYTYAFNPSNEFQEIRIFPDIYYLDKFLDADRFEQIADKMVIEFAKENNFQTYDQNNTLTKTKFSINNNTSFSYLLTEVDENGIKLFQKVFIGLTSGYKIFGFTYGNTVEDFNSTKSQNTMNNFIQSINDKYANNPQHIVWKEYTNKNLGVSFQIPSHWELFTKDNRFLPGPDLMIRNNTIEGMPTFSFLRDQLMDNTLPFYDAKSLSASLIDTWIKDPDLVIVEDDREHKIKDSDTAGFCMTIKNPDGEDHAKLILTVINQNKVYTLTYEDLVSIFDSPKNQELMNRILSTFTFSK